MGNRIIKLKWNYVLFTIRTKYDTAMQANNNIQPINIHKKINEIVKLTSTWTKSNSVKYKSSNI